MDGEDMSEGGYDMGGITGYRVRGIYRSCGIARRSVDVFVSECLDGYGTIYVYSIHTRKTYCV